MPGRDSVEEGFYGKWFFGWNRCKMKILIILIYKNCISTKILVFRECGINKPKQPEYVTFLVLGQYVLLQIVKNI